MIREREIQTSRITGIIISILSVLIFIVSVYIAQFIYGGYLPYSNEYLTIAFLIIPIWYMGVRQTRLTNFYRFTRYLTLIFKSGIFVITGTGFLAFAQYAFNLTQVHSLVIMTFAVLDTIVISAMLIFTQRYYRRLKYKGLNIQNAIIIADENCLDFIERLSVQKEMGYNINTIIADSELLEEIFGSRYRVIKDASQLPALLRQDVIDEVLYCRNKIDQDEIKSLIYACEEIGVVFRMQSSFFRMPSTKTHLSYYEGIPFLTFTNTPDYKFSHHWKFLFDISAAFFILLIWSPVIIAIALAIKLTSPGPVIFKQKRVGLRGRLFDIYKFRTMVVDAEKLKEKLTDKNEMDGPVFKIKNDPRITSIGRILRKTGLDEIPQFFNVLNGDMSLVGPRPPLPAEVAQYERWQLRRLSMRPGITCIWQIAPNRNSISFNEWMKLDLQYIDSWSLKLDIILLIKTAQTVLKGSGS